jgi:hypothetical protein
MAKVWKKDHPIPWICNEEENTFFAATGDYRLKVELRSGNRWFWEVTYKGEDVLPINQTVSRYVASKFHAIGLSEGVYMGHKESGLEPEFEIRFFRSAV